MPSHRLTRAAAAVIGSAALALAGCSSNGSQARSESGSSQAADFLSDHDLAGKSVPEIIDQLDRSAEDKSRQLVGSVRYDSLALTDGETGQEVTLPIDDGFYLAVAPYVEKTHDCYYHNLASCQGELVDADLQVLITAADGEVLVDETVTTYQNGFAGFWLPRDIEGTIAVTHDGKSVESPFATSADSPTCVTTLQLG